MIRDAVTCDTPTCLGIMLEPVDDPYATDGPEFEDVITAAGWTYDESGHLCPACQEGRPVLERGECPQCGGRVGNHVTGERCLSCGHTTPYPEDDQDDEETGQ